MPHLATAQEKVPRQNATKFNAIRGGMLQRKCACGGTAGLTGQCCSEKKRFGLQTKLKLNNPGCNYEQKAERIADQGPISGTDPVGETPLRRNRENFGHDFSALPVHADAMSPLTLLGQARNALTASLGEGAGRIAIEIASTKTKGAEGATVGRRVYLAPGRFDTQSYEGRVRLGHEVAHGIQQERGAGLSSELVPGQRAVLETEAERAGRAFADGRRFSIAGKAPTRAALFRGPGEEQQAEVDRELDAAIQAVVDKHVARGVAIAKDRKERHDYILANLEWREYDVRVDAALRKTPATRQPQELWMRVLQMAFPTISREDAAEVLRRTRMSAESVESESIAEQIRTRRKIHFRTKYMRLLGEVYNEIGEDRARASLYVGELLNAGPDMALEMFKDVGRGYYNGVLSFAQGLADLPVAPVNLIQSLRGGEQIHTVDLSGLRADYRTSYGVHYGSSIELGTVLGLTVVSGRLPIGAGGGAGAAANTASQASRAARLFSSWMKINAVSAGATAVVEAGKAMRDIARGYVIENGKRRPLTEDEILARLGGIAFGVQAAKIALRSPPGKTGGGPVSSTAPAVPEMTIESTTPSKIQVSVPGEPNRLLIDDTGWRVLAKDGEVLAKGSPDEGTLLASKLQSTQAAEPTSPTTAPAANSPVTSSGQTAPAQTAPRVPSRVDRLLQKLYLSVGMTVDELVPQHRDIAGGSIGKRPVPAVIEKAPPAAAGQEVAPSAAPKVEVPVASVAETAAVQAPVETPTATVAEVPASNPAPAPTSEPIPAPAPVSPSTATMSAAAAARPVTPTTASAATEIPADESVATTAAVQTQPAPPSAPAPTQSATDVTIATTTPDVPPPTIVSPAAPSGATTTPAATVAAAPSAALSPTTVSTTTPAPALPPAPVPSSASISTATATPAANLPGAAARTAAPTARDAAIAFRARCPKLDQSAATLDGLEDIFRRTMSGKRSTTPRPGRYLPSHTRGAAGELEAIWVAQQDPAVVSIRVVPPQGGPGAQRTPDLLIDVQQPDGTIVTEAGEVRTLTGGRVGYQPTGSRQQSAADADSIARAITAKIFPSGKPSQLASGGVLHVQIRRGGANVDANIAAAVNRLNPRLAGAGFVHELHFHLLGGRVVRYVRGPGGTFIVAP